MNAKLKKAKLLLESAGFRVIDPEPESEYAKAMRTGVIPDIWPPIVMSQDELEQWRKT